MPIANVALSNTFNEFRSTTNEVIETLNVLTSGNGTLTLADLDVNGPVDVTGNVAVTGTLDVSGLTVFSSNVQISGNLIVSGNVNTLDYENFVITDPIALLAANNAGDITDLGFVAHYVDSGNTKHTGFIRHASSDTWYLFKDYEPHVQCTNILDINDPTFTYANLAVGCMYSDQTVNTSVSCARTCGVSPILCGTSCVTTPVSCATTCAITPVACATTCVISPNICGTSFVNTAIACGTTCAISPIVCGTTCVVGAYVCGTCCLESARVCGTACVMSPVICTTNVDINATDGFRLPGGTCGERPVSPANGTIRFNTEESTAEIYDGTEWGPLGGGGGVTSYTYDNRGTLRITPAEEGTHAFVEDIGYFIYKDGLLTEVDDDETAFIVSGQGTWILSAPTWNFVEVYTEFDNANRNFSSIVPNTLCGFTCQTSQYALVPGASPGDIYTVVPNEGCVCFASVSARFIDCLNCVEITAIPTRGACGFSTTCVGTGCGTFVCNLPWACCCSCMCNVCFWKIYVQKV